VEDAYRKALDASSDLYEARAALAAIAEADDDVASAREGLEALVLLNPRDLLLQRKLGRLRRDAGDPAGAAQALEAAISLGDGSKETWTVLASVYRILKNPEAEIRVLQRLRRLDPRDRGVLVRLFNLRLAANDAAGQAGPAGQVGQAGQAGQGGQAGIEEQARALLALDPRDASAHLALARRREAQRDVLGQMAELQAAAAGTDPPEAPGTRERARAELADLRSRLMPPERPLFATNADALFLVAQRHLTRLYEARRLLKPELQGKIGVRLRLSATGNVDLVETVEDTLGDPVVAGGFLVALQEGSWPPLGKTFTLRFDLAPPGAQPPEPELPPRAAAPKAAHRAPQQVQPAAPSPPKRSTSALDLAAPR
jgi:hypothetical protein